MGRKVDLKFNRQVVVWILLLTLFLSEGHGFAKRLSTPTPSKQLVRLLPRSGARTDNCSPSTEDGIDTGQLPILLKGSIEHSVSLPPVAPGLRLGVTYDPVKIPKPSPTNRWYQIPSWFAGTWKTETNTRYYAYNYKSFRVDLTRDLLIAFSTETVGWQQDRNGGIWEYQDAPYVASVDGGDHIEIQYIQSAEPIRVSEHVVIIKYRSTSARVDKITRRIVRVGQDESFQTYQPYGEGYFKCTASMKVFDGYGKPARLQKNVAAAIRIQPFEAIDSMRDMDMRTKFREYLLSHRLSKLLP